MDRKKKTFDAVKMVRKIRDNHYERLKDKMWEERVAFYQEEARALREEIEAENAAAKQRS